MEVKTLKMPAHEVATEFAKNLGQVMKARGVTAYKLAQVTGLSKSLLYRLLDSSAANDPTISTVKRLSAALKCSPLDLIGT